MPLFEHISDRLRCSGLHTNVYPFSYDTVQLNYDGYRISKLGEVYSPVEEMALMFFGDSRKIKERNLRRLGTRHEGVTIHATLRDTTGAVVRTIKPERIVNEVRKIVFGTVSLVEEEQEHPKEADFVATVSYFSKSRTYPDIVDITAGLP
ncbi:MAG: hypothetical protein NTX24_04185 [Candidatus Pacearchaeota archaeon]|nr:hypothetical protein [Candidatus Pacearchaeota archaeon]